MLRVGGALPDQSQGQGFSEEVRGGRCTGWSSEGDGCGRLGRWRCQREGQVENKAGGVESESERALEVTQCILLPEKEGWVFLRVEDVVTEQPPYRDIMMAVKM